MFYYLLWLLFYCTQHVGFVNHSTMFVVDSTWVWSSDISSKAEWGKAINTSSFCTNCDQLLHDEYRQAFIYMNIIQNFELSKVEYNNFDWVGGLWDGNFWLKVMMHAGSTWWSVCYNWELIILPFSLI